MTLIGWVKSFFSWLWSNRLRLLLTVFSAFVFLVLLFPYDDLSDLVSAQVTKLSRNSVFLQFEKLKLAAFPQPGLQMQKVFIETLSLQGLSIQELTVTPSLSALISQKPHGSIVADGVLGGRLDVKTNDGGKSERGVELTGLQINAQKISLGALKQLADLPLLLKGKLNFEGAGKIDLQMQEQPQLQTNLQIQQFEMPASNLATQMGDIPVPEIKLTDIQLKGRIADGRFLIESGRFGGPQEDLNGTIKGSIQINLRNDGSGVVPEFGSYSIDIDLQPSPAFKQKAGLYLSFLSSYAQGDRYRFKVSGINFAAPPNMSALK